MVPEVLFLRRCEQLAQLSQTADYPNMVDCALYLYQLLIDQHTLVGAVNKNRLKIIFHARQLKELKLPAGMPQPYARALGMAIDPLAAPGGYPPQAVGLDAFLKLHIMTLDGNKLTVKDVIKYARHVDGGGHYDPGVLTGEFALLRRFGEEVLIQGAPVAAAQIAPLAWVTLRGLEPLVADVRARQRA